MAQERRRVQAALPMESRSQPDSEATDVKIDEDSRQDRDKGNSNEANKLKDPDTPKRQLQPCAKDDGVTILLEEKMQERDELNIQLQNHKPLLQRLRLATEAKAKASKGLEVAKREEADIVELSALKRTEVGQFKDSRTRICNTTTVSNWYRTETGSAELCHFESPGVHSVAAPLSLVQCAAVPQLPQRRSAGRLRCLLQGARAKGLGTTAKTPVIPPAPAPATPPPHAGAFAPFPKPTPARVDPPPPQGVP